MFKIDKHSADKLSQKQLKVGQIQIKTYFSWTHLPVSSLITNAQYPASGCESQLCENCFWPKCSLPCLRFWNRVLNSMCVASAKAKLSSAVIKTQNLQWIACKSAGIFSTS